MQTGNFVLPVLTPAQQILARIREKQASSGIAAAQQVSTVASPTTTLTTSNLLTPEATTNVITNNETNLSSLTTGTTNDSSDHSKSDSTNVSIGVAEKPAITLNHLQLAFANLVTTRSDCILVGAAGTGKTTAVKYAVSKLLEDPTVPTMSMSTGSFNSPRLRQGIKGIVGCAFTNRAVGNLTANFPESMQDHCMTIHALLEYQPTEDMQIDEATGELVKKMMFEPNRNRYNPLPKELKVIIIEESSMVGTDLWMKLVDAIQHKVQFVFLGDLNQLSPVFGDAILGYKLLELPVIELTEVYRQALESPIIRLAHKILGGKQMLYKDFSKEHNGEDSTWQVPNKLTIGCWQAGTSAEIAELTAIKYLEREYDKGNYIPESDMIIIPFNKSFGSIGLSKGIANFLDNRRQQHPVEIIAGWNKSYFAIGDLVLHRNEEYIVTEINRNSKYRGIHTDQDLIYNRFGTAIGRKSGNLLVEKSHDDILNEILLQDDDKTTQDEASHVLTMQPVKTTRKNKGDSISISSRGAINGTVLAYATTCHKAQGLEARKVFIVVHKAHAVLLSREWLYTAVTRAREELVILCERDTFIKGINNQQIKGNTLAAKAEYFKGKKASQGTSY